MLRIVLVVVTGASAAVLPPSLTLDLVSNSTLPSQPSVVTLTSSFLETSSTNLSLPSLLLPDDRFSIKYATDMKFLPVEAALINILNFMGVVAAEDFTHGVQPRTYSTSSYRNVEITSYMRTEGRYLLWGVFYAINYMVKVVRFYDLEIELLWEGILVGRVEIAVKRTMNLAGGATQDLVARSIPTGSDNVTAGAFNNSAALSYPRGFSVEFSNIPGVLSVDRNQLFLTFYIALLHVAEFPAGGRWRIFESVSPDKALTLIMQDVGSDCSVSQPKLCLTFTPKRRQMDHKEKVC